MLEALHIENIAVVKSVDIDLFRGFSVLTGETGVGKSVILGAISLLLGAKNGKELVRTGEQTATVSALFSDLSEPLCALLAEVGVAPDEDGCLMLTRTVSAEGRSTARINGRAIPASMAREVGKHLINIHGQHDSYALMQAERHLGFLDAYAETDALFQTYKEAYQIWRGLLAERDALVCDERERDRRLEMLRYQIADIEEVGARAGEEEALLAKRDRIRNFEKVQKQLSLVRRALGYAEKTPACTDLLRIAITAIGNMRAVLPEAEAYIDRLETCSAEISDIVESVSDQLAEDSDEDPTELLNKLEERLDKFHRLKRKYGATMEEVLEYLAKAKAELATLTHADETLAKLDKALSEAERKVRVAGAALTKKRQASAETLGKAIMAELAFLEMKKVRFSVSVTPLDEPAATGLDRVEFLISTNPGEPLRPMERIASGGELSRIMLALKTVLAAGDPTDVLIFDEIDTGISGGISQKVGMKLKAIARGSAQVLCITHAAQIAALADKQYRISKGEQDGRSVTTVTPLAEEERPAEIARMMGGMEITDTLLSGARELLANSKKL